MAPQMFEIPSAASCEPGCRDAGVPCEELPCEELSWWTSADLERMRPLLGLSGGWGRIKALEATENEEQALDDLEVVKKLI